MAVHFDSNTGTITIDPPVDLNDLYKEWKIYMSSVAKTMNQSRWHTYITALWHHSNEEPLPLGDVTTPELNALIELLQEEIERRENGD